MTWWTWRSSSIPSWTRCFQLRQHATTGPVGYALNWRIQRQVCVQTKFTVDDELCSNMFHPWTKAPRPEGRLAIWSQSKWVWRSAGTTRRSPWTRAAPRASRGRSASMCSCFPGSSCRAVVLVDLVPLLFVRHHVKGVFQTREPRRNGHFCVRCEFAS